MTTEEYRENLIRMWDSLRTEYKGKRNCDGIECNNCPFNGKVCYAGERLFHAYDAIEIVETVENWAKQHHVVTNADKFREVFGMEKLPFYSCIYTNKNCEDCEYFIGMGCKPNSSFWNAEYNDKPKE